MKVKKIHYCVSCGAEVPGRTKKCNTCKEKEKLHQCSSCENMISGRERKCQDCKDREKEAKRWKTCSCGITFRLDDHQSGGEKVCPRCKDEKFRTAHDDIMNFFDKPRWAFLPLNERIHKTSSIRRNIIQAINGPEFKLFHIHFSKIPHNSTTWDHVNSMTYFIEKYISDCISDPSKKEFDYFKEYLLKYAIQFRVTPELNRKLSKYQTTGITPEQYISVVGLIEGTETIEESIEIIKPYFING